MPKENPFKEFIESLSQLNGFEKDSDVKAVDEALASWIVKYHPKGFNFNYDRRNLLINMVKKAAKMGDLIKNSAFGPYIDALINMKWLEVVYKKRAKSKTGEDYYVLLLDFAREIFILGYCLKSLESKKGKPPKERGEK